MDAKSFVSLQPSMFFPRSVFAVLLPGQGQENLRLSLRINEISFGYIYVAHPRSVTAVSWRKTSKYMPKGAVANVLATSCTDNICRLWCETVSAVNSIDIILLAIFFLHKGLRL